MPVLVLQTQQLTATELSLGAAAALARRTFVGAELGLAHRPAAGSRLALALAGGTAQGRAAGRAQLTLQLLVSQSARSGAGFYAGVGGAFAARRGAPGQGLLAVLLGCEAAPGARQGWYVEVGLAGGVRAAVGWRLRWFPAWWRSQGLGLGMGDLGTSPRSQPRVPIHTFTPTGVVRGTTGRQ